jgi:hypothetical protein
MCRQTNIFSQKGSKTLGEFINPARDCSDVLNHDPQANDGFYWINLKIFKAKKVIVMCIGYDIGR